MRELKEVRFRGLGRFTVFDDSTSTGKRANAWSFSYISLYWEDLVALERISVST
jgi:hypothetical protein